MPTRTLELAVRVLVEPEDHLRALDQNRSADEIWILHHQVDGFLLRPGQRTFLPHRTARADVVQEAFPVDMLLEPLARGWLLVDVDLADLDVCRVQKTSGVLAGRSRGLGVEGRLGHGR